MSPKKIRIVATVIGGFVSIFVIYLGFKIFSGVFSRAADTEPRDVVVSEISQNNAKVTWSTGIETQGVIEYGTSPTSLNFFAPEGQATKNHTVELTLLSPNTTYYFQIRIGDKKYDNGGVPWTFTTRVNDQTVLPTEQINKLSNKTTPTPTPVQIIEIPASNTNQLCYQTDCQKIKELLGKGCTTQDYFRCLRAPTPLTTP